MSSLVHTIICNTYTDIEIEIYLIIIYLGKWYYEMIVDLRLPEQRQRRT